LRHAVRALTAEEMQGRGAGSEGERRATAYVAQVFARVGLEPAGDDGTWFQSFDLKFEAPEERRGEGRNVLGRLPGTRPRRAPVVIGAHLDHLGPQADEGSLAAHDERDQVHEGADDNASGVAALLGIAGSLASQARHRPLGLERGIVFAAWSGEEIGLLGSEAFVEQLTGAGGHGTRAISAYLNLDMVGRLRHRLLIYGMSSSSVWPSQVERQNAVARLPVVRQDNALLPTDATSFHSRRVPALSFFTGMHAEYHTPRDRGPLLNYDGLREIARLVEAIAVSLAQSSDLPDFLEPEVPSASLSPPE
jgi:Zn-dependent M28 family amino/carboxypeptidase